MTDGLRATAKRRENPPSTSDAPLASADIVRKRSRIHGAGVFARRPIAPGTRIVEYTGDRISQREADRRYENRAYDDNHTFLFQIDKRLVVDGGVGGSLARFINHSCAGNCEVVIDRRRIFIEALRAIAPGEELTYDYLLVRAPDDPPDLDQVYACRCGSPQCRGTMLAPKPKRKAAATSKARSKTKSTARAKAKPKPATKPKATKTRSKAARTKSKSGRARS